MTPKQLRTFEKPCPHWETHGCWRVSIISETVTLTKTIISNFEFRVFNEDTDYIPTDSVGGTCPELHYQSSTYLHCWGALLGFARKYFLRHNERQVSAFC